MLMPRPLEEAADAFGDVALEVAQPNGMTKYTATPLFDPACGFEEPLALDLFQDHQQLTWGDGRDGPQPNPREDIPFQQTQVFVDRGCRQRALVDANLEDLQPGSCDGFKRLGVRRAQPAALGAGIDAAREEAAGILVATARLGETDLRY
jgi:hypothetical protein